MVSDPGGQAMDPGPGGQAVAQAPGTRAELPLSENSWGSVSSLRRPVSGSLRIRDPLAISPVRVASESLRQKMSCSVVERNS